MATEEARKRIRKMCGELGLGPIAFLPASRSRPSSNFHLTFTTFIHVKPGRHERDDCIHEVGHLHLRRHLGGVIPVNDFRGLFGNVYRRSPELDAAWEATIEPRPEFATTYAQTHPVEDYCETFVLAWKAVKRGVRKSYGNRVLNRKVSAVKTWIRETMI